MRAAFALAPVALLATACGSKAEDPYAKSLAMGSEHVEFTADATNGRVHKRIRGSGDFSNVPDRGRYSFAVDGKSQQQVFADGRIFVHVYGRWLSQKMSTHTPQTPAQMFRARLPATMEGGLVRSITVHDTGGDVKYVFSKYGEPVSITVPRVKGSK